MRRLVSLLLALLLPEFAAAQGNVLLPQYPPGQKAMAASLPVVLPSDQTVPISVASLPLPTGAATEATLGGVLTTSAFQARIPVTGQAAMAASVPVVIASNQSTLPIAGGLTNNNAAPGANNVGALIAIANAAAPSYTEGRQVLASVDLSGALRVNCTSGCGGGTGGTAMSDEGAFTPGSTQFTPVGGTYRSTRDTVTDNAAAAVALNQRRGVYVSLETPNSDSVADESLDTVKVSQATAANLNATVVLGSSSLGAGAPLPVRQSDGAAFQTYAALDLDSGAGTVSRIAVGIAGAASGGPIAIEGTTANGLEVDVTRVQGTVTVDSELGAAIAAADDLASPTAPPVLSFNFCRDQAGSNWDMCRSSLATETSPDATGITWTSVVGGFGLLRASTSEPTNVTADRPVWAWAHTSGALNIIPRDSDGDDATDAPNNALKVSIVAPAALPVSQSGAWTADTELAAAAAQADGASNPTIPNVGAFQSIFNGSTFDRQRSVVNAMDTTGTGIAAAGILAQLDDTSPGTVTENQFTTLRLTSGRALHVAQQGNVTINTIPAGSNNIGDVDVLTLPALPAGTNNIGDVDVLTMPATGSTGSAVPSTAMYIAGRAGANLRPFTNCDTNAHLRMTTATTTELVAAPGSGRVRFCSLQLFAEGTTNVTIVRGTGSNCGTGTTTVAGPFALSATVPGWNLPVGIGEVLDAGADTAAVCITSSAAVGLTILGRTTSY